MVHICTTGAVHKPQGRLNRGVLIDRDVPEILLFVQNTAYIHIYLG